MPRAEFYTAVDTSVWIAAGAYVVAAVAFPEPVDRALSARGHKRSSAVAGGELSPVATTRLRLVRGLIFAGIVLIGLALALSRFPSVNRLATGVLASSAVIGIVVGFAARQTLANGIAGILLAITQPFKDGDLVSFEGQTGVVEEVRLRYTYVRCEAGRSVIVRHAMLGLSTLE